MEKMTQKWNFLTKFFLNFVSSVVILTIAIRNKIVLISGEYNANGWAEEAHRENANTESVWKLKERGQQIVYDVVQTHTQHPF